MLMYMTELTWSNNSILCFYMSTKFVKLIILCFIVLIIKCKGISVK